MARPKKEGMDYFPHDTDAVNDEKIESLRFLYGNDGYAFYFILLERIYRSKHFELDVSDAETIQILCRKVDVNLEKFNQILEYALKKGCFDKAEYEKRKVLTSEGIKNRASVVVGKRVKMREEYHNSKVDEVSAAETPPETEQKRGKVKESKVKESKEKEINNISAIEIAFDEFWKVYPRKLDKKKAFEKFKAAAKKHDPASIIDGAKKYAAECQVKKTDKQYIKHPSSFLNAESFNNDFEGGQRSGTFRGDNEKARQEYDLPF